MEVSAVAAFFTVLICSFSDSAVVPGRNRPSNKHNQTISEFWTSERMEAAQMLTNQNIGQATCSNSQSGRRKKRSDPWSKSRMQGAIDPFPIVSEEYFGDEGTITLLSATVSEATIYDATLNDVPFKHMGKLYFTNNDGNQCACSGTYIGPTDHVLLTAAHCVRDSNGYYSDFMFSQQYNNGVGHRKGVSYLFVPSQYNANDRNDLSLDYAFLVTKQPSENGGVGLYTGVPTSKITAAGYPKNVYDGQKLVWLSGGKGAVFHGLVHMPSNSMQMGSSGGAWLRSAEDGWYATGINSHTNTLYSGMFSPVFDEGTTRLYNDAESWYNSQQKLPRPECSASQFMCTDRSCINKDWVCDGDRDCSCGCDEHNC